TYPPTSPHTYTHVSPKAKDTKFQTVGSEFRRQLKDLMTNVSFTTPHYVRCIKPNAQNKSSIYDHTLVCMQLKCCGVIEAVRVSRAGFPNRFSCGDFVERYRGVYTYYLYAQANLHTPTMLPSSSPTHTHTQTNTHTSKKRVLASSDSREQAMELCTYVSNLVIQHTAHKPLGGGGGGGVDVMVRAGMQIGISLVFMRRNCFDILEQMRMYVYKLSCVCMQKYYRRYVTYSYYTRLRRVCIHTQCCVRRAIAKRHVRHVRHTKCSICIQRYVRGYVCRRYRKMCMIWIVRIQTHIRMHRAYKVLLGYRRASAAIMMAKCFRRCVMVHIHAHAYIYIYIN
ncbi:hypothetical protein EON63_22200, partial [archaeon]